MEVKMGGWVTTTSALLAFSLYYNTLDNGFVYDDRRAILSNPDVIGHTPIQALFENDFWGTPLIDPGSHGSYRPLCVATYRLNYAFSGFKPWSYHFLNVIFHCLATVLVVATASRLLPKHCKRVGTAVAGLTFAAHPIHTEAVAGVVGRADLAACTFFLISFLVYTEHIRLREQSQIRCCRHILKSQLVRKQVTDSDQPFRLSCHGLVQHIIANVRRLLKAGKKGPMKVFDACEVKTDPSVKLKCQYSASVSEDSRISGELLQWFTLTGTLLFAVAATLCKEPGIMVLPLCILYDFLKGFRQEESASKYRWRSVSALSMGGFALLCWRLRLTGAPSTFAAADNPASRDSSFLTRFYTFSYLPAFNFFLLLYPFHLSFDWSMDAIPRITTIFDPRNISTFIFYGLLTRVTWRALAKEFNIRQEKIKKEKYYKKYVLKVKQKCIYNKKQYCKEPYCVEKKGYCTPPKDNTSRRYMCPCTGCNHPLTEDHTNACRAVNNNNIMMQYSHCVCPKFRAQTVHASVYKSSQVALLVSTAFMVLPFVPASNLLFYVGFVVAERVLYIPSVGLCLLLGLGAGTLSHKWHRCEARSKILVFGLLLTLAAMCGYTLKRNLDWRDEESLFRSAVDINPPKAYGNLGSVLTAQGRTAEAVVAFEKALLHRPNMADVHYNLGILLQNQRRYGEAIKSFERAIYFRPSMALAYVNMGVSLMADGRMAEAANVLRAGSRADGSRVRDRREHDAARVSALVQLAALHSQVGNWNKALMSYKEALQILPQSNAPLVGWTRHSILSMAGEIYVQLEQWGQAESSILSALALAPYNVAAHVTMAQILARNTTRVAEAEMWYKKAVTIAPNDPSVRDQFGMFLWSQRRLSESADQYVAAAKLVPKDDVRAAAAARALRDSERCAAAERWYAKAAELKPENPEHHSNLGAILHLNGKYDAAISSYYRALQLQPNDAITMTNLKRVRSLKNRHRTNM